MQEAQQLRHRVVTALAVLTFAATACSDEPAGLDGPRDRKVDALVGGEAGPALFRVSDGPLTLRVAKPVGAPGGGGPESSTSVVYSSLGDEAWPVSLGYEATGTIESGDYVAVTRPGVLSTVDVGMSSWACESGGWNTGDCATAAGATFTHPITLNLYAVDYSGSAPATGAVLASVEESFAIPYRPSADPATCPADPEKFYDARFGRCVNGLNTTITFDLSALDLVVPGEVIFGVEYNTETSGPNPIGSPGPFDALNVAYQSDVAALIGSSVNEDDLVYEAIGVPFDLYQFGDGAWPYLTAAAFSVTNEGSVTGGGWIDSPEGALTLRGDGVVNGNPDDGWAFNAEPPFVTPAALTSEQASTGLGSLAVSPITNSSTSAEKLILRYVPEEQVLLSDLSQFSIDFLIDAAGSNPNPNQFYLNLYTLTPDPSDGASWFDCRFDYVATSGSTSSWTPLGFTPTTAATAVDDRIGGACPSSFDAMPAGSTVLFLSVNLGDTSGSDTGSGGFFDNATMTVGGAAHVWDFEPRSPSGKATFGFVSRYRKGANTPDGNTQFNFNAGGLSFHSTSYDWLVVNQAGQNAQFKGEGAVNGMEGYMFMIWAGDHDAGDTFRIKIWEETLLGEAVVYDNGTDQLIGSGNISVHDGKAKK